MVTQPPPVELRQPAQDHSANLSVRLKDLQNAIEAGTGQVQINPPVQPANKIYTHVVPTAVTQQEFNPATGVTFWTLQDIRPGAKGVDTSKLWREGPLNAAGEKTYVDIDGDKVNLPQGAVPHPVFIELPRFRITEDAFAKETNIRVTQPRISMTTENYQLGDQVDPTKLKSLTQYEAEINAAQPPRPAVRPPAPAAAPPGAAVVVQPQAVNGATPGDIAKLNFRDQIRAGADGQATATQMLFYLEGEVSNYHASTGAAKTESLGKMNDYLSRMPDSDKAFGIKYVQERASGAYVPVSKYVDEVVKLHSAKPEQADQARRAALAFIDAPTAQQPAASPPQRPTATIPGLTERVMDTMEPPAPANVHTPAGISAEYKAAGRALDHLKYTYSDSEPVSKKFTQAQIAEVIVAHKKVSPEIGKILEDTYNEMKASTDRVTVPVTAFNKGSEALSKWYKDQTIPAPAVAPAAAPAATAASAQAQRVGPEKTPQQLYEANIAAPVLSNGKPVTVQMPNGDKRVLWVEKQANNDPDYVLKNGADLTKTIEDQMKKITGQDGAESNLSSLVRYQSEGLQAIVSKDPPNYKYNDPNAPGPVQAAVLRLNGNEPAAETVEGEIKGNPAAPLNLGRPGV